jgi:hypothetical protein
VVFASRGVQDKFSPLSVFSGQQQFSAKDDSCPSPDSFTLEQMKGSIFAENCCCPENTDKGENLSCTPLLAKTTHRTINKSGRGNLVERFQPQITGSVGGLVKNYLNGSFQQVDASVFF